MIEDIDALPDWQELPHTLEMTAVAKRGHFSLHLIDGKPVVLSWRKVINRGAGNNKLDKRWTVMQELPEATRGIFERALQDWDVLGGKR